MYSPTFLLLDFWIPASQNLYASGSNLFVPASVYYWGEQGKSFLYGDCHADMTPIWSLIFKEHFFPLASPLPYLYIGLAPGACVHVCIC